MRRNAGYGFLIVALFLQGMSAMVVRAAGPDMEIDCPQHATMNQDESAPCCDEHCATASDCLVMCAVYVAIPTTRSIDFAEIFPTTSDPFFVVRFSDRSYAPLYPPPIA